MTPQELYLELIRQSSFNGFNGEEVYDFLSLHKIWRAAIMVHDHPAFPLRDLPDEINNVDTLYLTIPKEEDARSVCAEAKNIWKADEADVLNSEDASRILGSWGKHNPYVVRIWWD